MHLRAKARERESGESTTQTAVFMSGTESRYSGVVLIRFMLQLWCLTCQCWYGDGEEDFWTRAQRRYIWAFLYDLVNFKWRPASALFNSPRLKGTTGPGSLGSFHLCLSQGWSAAKGHFCSNICEVREQREMFFFFFFFFTPYLNADLWWLSREIDCFDFPAAALIAV